MVGKTPTGLVQKSLKSIRRGLRSLVLDPTTDTALREMVHTHRNGLSLSAWSSGTATELGGPAVSSHLGTEVVHLAPSRETRASTVTEIVMDTAKVWEVHPLFAEQYLRRNFPNYEDYSTIEALLASAPELKRFYATYALDTCRRGKSVFARVARHLRDPGEGDAGGGRRGKSVLARVARHLRDPGERDAGGGRGGEAVFASVAHRLRPGARWHLDVGSGYGGTSRQFASNGFKCVAIEIDSTLAEYTRANTADLPVTVINQSFVGADLSSFGQFDVITMNQVIEHVADPSMAMKRVAEMLRPGGVLLMETPNRDYINYVEKDGHFLQFGIAQLSRQEARQAKDSMTGGVDTYEHMGEYYPLEYYLGDLRSHGLEVWTDSTYHMNVADYLPAVGRVTRAFEEFSARTDVAYFSRHAIQTAVSSYLSQFWSEYSKATIHNAWPDFHERFGTEFWAILARRPG